MDTALTLYTIGGGERCGRFTCGLCVESLPVSALHMARNKHFSPFVLIQLANAMGLDRERRLLSDSGLASGSPAEARPPPCLSAAGGQDRQKQLQEKSEEKCRLFPQLLPLSCHHRVFQSEKVHLLKSALRLAITTRLATSRVQLPSAEVRIVAMEGHVRPT